jgi:ABC-2 type transport system permease protein
MNADSTYTINSDAVVSKYRSTPKGEKLFVINKDSIIHIVDKDTIKSWPLNGYVEVGIFTESTEDDKVQQKPSYLKKVKLDSIFHSFDIQVDQKPVEVGIDPFNKLIDTNSNDNRKAL